MSSGATTIAARAVAMRSDFDRVFAERARFDDTQKHNFLAIHAGGQPCAIRLSEISGLHAGKKITGVPGGHAALRGIAGFRGAILPVYDLPNLLGLSVGQTPRWLLVANATPVALAFERFEGQLRVARDAVMPRPGDGSLRGCAREFLQTPEFSGPIIDLPPVLDAIKALSPVSAS